MKYAPTTTRYQHIAKIVLIILCASSGIASLLIAWKFICTKNTIEQKANEFAQKTTQKTASYIANSLEALATYVDSLAQELSKNTISEKNIPEILNKKPSSIHGIGIAFAPYTYNKEKKLFAPYVIKQHGKNQLVALEDSVDYSATSYARFLPALQGSPTLQNPFFDEASQTIVVEYSTPLYDQHKKIIGVVFGNYTIKDMQKTIEKSFPSRFGYASIIDFDGTYIFHPNYTFVEHKETAPRIAQKNNDPILAHNMEQAIKGNIKSFSYKNLVSGQNSWIFFEKIPSTHWYAAGTFVINDTIPLSRQYDIELILLIAALAAFATFGLLYITGVYVGTERRLRIGAAIFSMGMLTVILTIWYREWIYTDTEPTEILEKNANLQALISNFYTEEKNNDQSHTPANSIIKSPIMVYTGIYIHKLSIDIDTVTLIGYIWQKYPIDVLQKINLGVVLPQARECVMEEAYKTRDATHETTGWSVRCTLQQKFNFQDYPIDFQKIKILLWPITLSNEYVLVPDLESYKTLNPSNLPGINTGIKLQDWHLKQSSFSFEKETYATNFGFHSANSYTLIGRDPKMRLPKLAFNIIVDRQASNSMILSLLPIVVIITLLFIIILMARMMHFHSMLASISSLFFTTLFAYGIFKANIPTQKTIFFDYLYFVIELAILSCAIMAIIYYKGFKVRWIQYDHMFIPQIVFWPIITTTILIVSILFFQYY